MINNNNIFFIYLLKILLKKIHRNTPLLEHILLTLFNFLFSIKFETKISFKKE